MSFLFSVTGMQIKNLKVGYIRYLASHSIYECFNCSFGALSLLSLIHKFSDRF